MSNNTALAFASPYQIGQDITQLIRPPRRITVPDAADQHVIIKTPGAPQSRHGQKLAGYMVEPANLLTERGIDEVIFVGPAQSGKTLSLVDDFAAYTIACSPMDLMIVQPCQASARDFSMRRIDRMLAASPTLRKEQLPGQQDNTHDKLFRSGMILSIGWPTKNQLAGKAIPRLAITDYDRIPDNLGGEGSVFTIANNRRKSFLSLGMVVCESSPSKPITDHKRRLLTAHEAPPTSGILGLYNGGDRRRLYAPCPHCGHYFMPIPDLQAMYIPPTGTISQRAMQAFMICPNGCEITQDYERTFKRAYRWLKEGQTIDPDGIIHGEGLFSRRASFWMPGWFAEYESWENLVAGILTAEQQYQRTGDEEDLKAEINTRLAAPYLYKAQRADLEDENNLESRTEELPRFQVPQGVRALFGVVDVQAGQGGYFDVLILGIGQAFETWVVDRFTIRDVQPKSRIEDWQTINERVINATYQVADDRELRVHATGVDSGGEEGVTTQAYNWWRSLKKLGLARRVHLIKGGSAANAPRVKQVYPDTSGRSDRKSGSRGDVPVLLLNTNTLKDTVHAHLTRQTPGPGYIHFPVWLPSTFFDGLAAEQRTAKGWERIGRRPNEPFDQLTYAQALWIHLGGEKINWLAPKPWLKPLDSGNSNVISSDDRRRLKDQPPKPKTATPSAVARPVRFRFGRARQRA